LKLCLNKEEEKNKKMYRPARAAPDANGRAEKTIILASVTQRKRTLADIKMRRDAGDALSLKIA
jgi:hypothetical protein